MKIYDGVPGAGGRPPAVTVSEGERAEPLKIYLDRQNYAPRFGWGHGSPTTRQLAFALLFDVFRDRHKAVDLSARFRDHVFAAIPRDEPWSLSDEQVRRLADAMERLGFRDTVAGVYGVATLEGRL